MPSSGQLLEQQELPHVDSRSLPEAYGATMAALLPRDPNWMYVYWEITPADKARIAAEHGADIFETARQVLRVHEMGPDGAAQRYFDVPVRLEARDWYVNAQDGGRAYCCELGLVRQDDVFIGIVKTNTAQLPPGRVSDALDEKWMSVSPDFDKLLQLSGVEYIGKGSGEVAKSLAQRWEMLRAVFSRASSWGISSMSSRAALPPAEKKFRLAADCELILYGATEPDAFVTVCGRKVDLNPDGTFSMRFALQDGATDLPVVAMSKDETDVRRVDIGVTRQTRAEGGPGRRETEGR